MAKAGTTQAEIEYRVSIVSSLIIRGKTRKEIVQFGSKKWEISDRQVDEYISKAKEAIQEESKSTIEADTAKARARLEFLYDKAIGNEDYNLARVLNKDFIEFTGVKAPNKVENTNYNIDLTEDEKKIALNKIKNNLKDFEDYE